MPTRTPRVAGFGRRDSYPENMIGKSYYRDTGCPGGCEKSLECPLPQCRYDDPCDFAGKDLRNKEIRQERRSGARVVDLAVKWNLGKRTVHRIVNSK